MKSFFAKYWALSLLVFLNLLLIGVDFKLYKDLKRVNTNYRARESKIDELERKIAMLKILTLNGVKSPIHKPIDKALNGRMGSIVLRFHENDCNDCVRHTIQYLYEYNKDHPTKKILVLVNYSNKEKLKREFPFIPFEIRYAKEINLDIKGIYSPYLFIVNSNGQYEKVLFPNFMAMDMVEQYLKGI
ncbi:MAG: hypothetical protein RLZ47_313 [Bacteroidota bacterium]|jgi:hypothetical protein